MVGGVDSGVGRWREGIVRELGMDMDTLLYLKMDNEQGPTDHIAQYCGSLGGRRGVWGRMDTCMCMAESIHCPPETISMLLIGYTPNTKYKV